MKVSTDIFIMGVCLGWGPCLSFCAPVIIPYIAASQSGWLKGLRAVIVFSLSRVAPYMILALIASSLGQLLIRRYYESKAGMVVYLVAGIFISILGLFFLFGQRPGVKICRPLAKSMTRSSLKELIGLGLMIGFTPCIPLFGVLTYIAFVSENIFEGLFYGVCFGVGTLLSPLLLFGCVAGGLSTLLLRKPSIYRFFSRVCGGFLFYFGVRLAISVLKGGLLR